jgi:hypothetical protein
MYHLCKKETRQRPETSSIQISMKENSDTLGNGEENLDNNNGFTLNGNVQSMAPFHFQREV